MISLPKGQQQTDPKDRNPISVLRRHSKSFHFAGRLLPHDQFQDIAQLYEFCRYTDDLVDRADNRAHAEESMNRILVDLTVGASGDAVVQRFLRLAERCKFSVDPARHLILGQLSDLDDVRLCTDAELKKYSYQVAGTVGLLMCGIMGVDDPRALPHAIDLGIGMQLTNIARDVAEDARAGRQYLPKTLVGTLDLEAVAQGDSSVRPAVQEAVRILLKDAEQYYQSGESGLAYLPSRARLGIFVASRIYHAIGTELRRHRFEAWHRRATVRLPRKVAIAADTSFEFIKRAFLHDPPASHDAYLHRHLSGCPGAHPPSPAVA